MIHRVKRFSQKAAVALVGLSLLGGVAVVAPTQSYAIPVAGDYAFTSGLSGTFTSDGSKLTAWNILGPLGGTFVTGGTVTNNFAGFVQGVIPSLSIVWNINPNAFSAGFTEVKSLMQLPRSGIALFSAVPEASTLVLGMLGLAGVMAFSWRRRQAGCQVG